MILATTPSLAVWPPPSGLVVSLATPAHAEFAIPGFELVHTVPRETALATPDLRDAAVVWKEMFDSAQREIVFGQFYVAGQDGEALDDIMAHLEAAGRRGVKIRFLMEKKGEFASVPATIESSSASRTWSSARSIIPHDRQRHHPRQVFRGRWPQRLCGQPELRLALVLAHPRNRPEDHRPAVAAQVQAIFDSTGRRRPPSPPASPGLTNSVVRPMWRAASTWWPVRTPTRPAWAIPKRTGTPDRRRHSRKCGCSCWTTRRCPTAPTIPALLRGDR
jgi:hypothetical protein